MTYLPNNHPKIKHNEECTHCTLGLNRVRHNKVHEEEENFVKQLSVGGAGPEDLTKVKLIVVSDYPGHYECVSREPMHDATKDRAARKRGLLQPYNAGGYLRMSLQLMYKLDTYEDCWITNAIKCNPNQLKAIDNQHTRPCSTRWLNMELKALDEYVPQVPILVLGNQALAGVCHVYGKQAAHINKLKVNGCRNREDLKVGEHPLVVTFNPAVAARSLPKIETAIKYNSRNEVVITSNEWLYPVLPGSPVDLFIKSLYPLAPYLT